MPTIHRTATPTNRFLGRCDTCVLPVAFEADRPGDVAYVNCVECGWRVKCERIYGTVDRMACDARCEGAVGNQCSCACGGANHGGAYLRTGQALASAVQRYRETTQRRRDAAQRRAATRRANREAEQREAEQQREIAMAQFVGNHQDVFTWIHANMQANDFAASLYGYFNRTGTLSERQVEAVRRNIQREQQRAAREAQEAATARPVPTGVQTIQGTIVSTRIDETYYGRTVQYSTKMLVKCDGFKIWSTVPREILREVSNHRDLVGRTIVFKASVVRSERDENFGIAKRPRDAQLVNVAQVEDGLSTLAPIC